MPENTPQAPDNQDLGRLVPLDIALDYAVKWDFARILRDLIQNFYDSIGYECFSEELNYDYKYEDGGTITLTISTIGHPFAYEWLCYMGGSTKTGKVEYIGEYGEGFKICALCLVRRGCSMTMESQDWSLRPCVYNKTVDDRKIPMLGYRVKSRKDDGITRLTIHGILSGEENIIAEGPLHFYYPENPLIRRVISDTENYALCERSDFIAVQHGFWGNYIGGVFFYRFLARGLLPFRLIILSKKKLDASSETRDRNVFLPFQIPILIYQVAVGMSPSDSYEMLSMMKEYWNHRPEFEQGRYFDINTWYYVICQLVRNVSRDDALTRRFVSENPRLVYLERNSSDTVKNRKIREARAWHRRLGERTRIVNAIFRLLGVPSLLEQYQNYLETTEFREPDAVQKKLGQILADAYQTVIPAELSDEEPSILICEGGGGNPAAFCRRRYEKARGGILHRKYKVEKLNLMREDFQAERFRETFMKYAVGRFRAYGMDGSARMAHLLTNLGSWMYDKRKALARYQASWEETANGCCETKSCDDVSGEMDCKPGVPGIYPEFL